MHEFEKVIGCLNLERYLLMIMLIFRKQHTIFAYINMIRNNHRSSKVHIIE